MLIPCLERKKERENCLLEGTCLRTPVPKPPLVQERKQATCVLIKCVLPYQRLKPCPPKENKHNQTKIQPSKTQKLQGQTNAHNSYPPASLLSSAESSRSSPSPTLPNPKQNQTCGTECLPKVQSAHPLGAAMTVGPRFLAAELRRRWTRQSARLCSPLLPARSP